MHRRKGNSSDGCTHWKPEEAQNVSVPQRSQKEAFPEKTFISDFWLLGPQVKFLLSFATPFVVICCNRNVLEASSWKPVESGEDHVLKKESRNVFTLIYAHQCFQVALRLTGYCYVVCFRELFCPMLDMKPLLNNKITGSKNF